MTISQYRNKYSLQLKRSFKKQSANTYNCTSLSSCSGELSFIWYTLNPSCRTPRIRCW